MVGFHARKMFLKEVNIADTQRLLYYLNYIIQLGNVSAIYTNIVVYSASVY